MSIAVEHERFILTATNESERRKLPTASRDKAAFQRSQVWAGKGPKNQFLSGGNS
jgi:hypothetical protein